MSQMVVLGDRDGNYYAFPAEEFERTLTSDEEGEYYAVSPEQIAAAKVPEERRAEVEEELGVSEVAGFGDPIPEVDVKLGHNPGGGYSAMGTVSVRSLPGATAFGSSSQAYRK